MEDDIEVHQARVKMHCSLNLLETLAGGDQKTMAILKKLLVKNETAVAFILLKGLEGSQIWELYESVCGRDMDRFIYHIFMELPCQCCGKLRMICAEYAREVGLSMESSIFHFRSRQNGRPNSFWALQDPPTEKDYGYPIVILNLNIEIG